MTSCGGSPLFALAFLIFSFLSCAPCVRGQTLTTEGLKELAPTLSTVESSFNQLLVEGWYATATYPILSFRLLWRRDGGSELVWGDAIDGTPLMVCAEGKALIYDAREACVYYHTGIEPYLRLVRLSPRDLQFGVGCRTAGPPDDLVPSGILIDLQSIVTKSEGSTQSASLGNGEYRLTIASPQGTEFSAWIEPSKASPYTRVQFLPPPVERGPRLHLTRIQVDGEPIPLKLKVPTPAELRKSIEVKDGDQIDVEQTAFRITLSSLVRLASTNPVIREQLAGSPAGKELDWEALSRSDATFSTKMRNLYRSPIIDPDQLRSHLDPKR